MIIKNDGTIIGTIGGGLLEAQTIEAAKEVYRIKKPLVKHFSLSGKDASEMDMICGGDVNVLLEHIDPSNTQQIEIYKTAAMIVGLMKKGWFITELLDKKDGEIIRPKRCVMFSDGKIVGDRLFKLLPGSGSPIGLFDHNEITPNEGLDIASAKEPVVVRIEEKQYLIEPLGILGTAYIFGGGHISLHLASLTKMVGFNTIVVDDREEFCNRERFPEVEGLVLLPSFEQIKQNLVIDPDSYLIIVTRGHLHDKTVLSYALKSKARYIGMIGSIKKRDAVYKQVMIEEGYSPDVFRKIHAPIGLEIGAESPEEIAISIVAELIKVRSGNQ